MSLVFRDHPDVGSALRTGYAHDANGFNADTQEERVDFLTDEINLLFHYLFNEEPDVLERFFEQYERKYKEWLTLRTELASIHGARRCWRFLSRKI